MCEQMQFAKEGPDWNNQYFRELDRIVNESALYPRPRMKRQVLYDDNTTMTIAYDNRTMDAVTVVGLPPSSTVMIQVRVLTKYFVGPASDPVRVTTPEGGMFVCHINRLTHSHRTVHNLLTVNTICLLRISASAHWRTILI